MWSKELPWLAAPFALSQLIYWQLLYYPNTEASIPTLIVKCLPVSTLALYIWSHGKRGDVANGILIGMIFSVLGDAFLVYDSLLTVGVAAFAVAHINFTNAFGFKDLNLPTGISLYAAMLTYLWFVSSGFPDALTAAGLPIYFFLLFTTAWRALDRTNESKNKPTRHLTAVGCVLFVISDSIIVYNMFVQPLASQQVLIMATYYAAQFLITLSAAQTFVDDRKERLIKNAQ